MSKLDKVFKHKLEHYNAEFPADAWDKIEARLPEPKKSNRLLLPILFSCLVLFFAGMSGLYINQLAENENIEAQNFKKDIIASGNHIINVENQISESQNIEVEDNTSEDAINKDATKNIFLTEAVVLEEKQKENFSEAFDLNEVEKIALAEDKRNVLEIESMENLSFEKLSSISNKELKFVSAFGSKEPTSKACPFVLQGRDKSLDLYYSSDFISKSLSGSETFDSYKSMRKETELPMYSFSAGFRFGYNLSYRWNIHTGANYSQINEKFQYVDPESNSTRVITIKDYIYENGRVVDSIVKEETVIVPGTTIHTVYNKFRTVDIPLLARYTLLANKYISVSALSGVYINIATFQRGMILSPLDQKPMDILQENADGYSMYKTNIGISLYGGLSVAYHLGANTDLLLEPHLRWQTETMTHQSYPLNQKINTFGLSTGIRYKF